MSALQSVCRSLAQYEWLILLLLFPIIIFLEPESAPILAVLPLLWLVRRVGNGRFFPLTPLNWPLYVLLVMAVVSLFVTFDFENSLPMAAGLIWGISLYFALVSFGGQSHRRLYLLIAGFLAAGVGITILGVLHPTFLDRLPLFPALAEKIPADLVRFPGDDDGFNANRISGTLLWVVPLTWVMGLTGGAGIRKKLPGWLTVIWALILIAIASVMSLTLMLLFSRAAQAAFLAIMVLLFGVLALKQRWVFILGIVLVIAAAVFLASSEESQVRLEQLVITIGGETTGGSTAVESISGRTKTWERAYYAIRDFPLTGMGMNNFPEVIATFYPLIDFRNASDITHAHNHFLIIGTDLGLPGIIAYAALMLGLGRMLWRSWRRTAEPGDKILVVGFGASLLAFELFGLFDGIGLGEKPTIFFWFLLGMTGSLFELVRRTSTSRQRRRRKRKRTEISIDTIGV